MVKTKVEQSIIDALEAVAADHGVDIVDVEVVGATKAPCVRVRIDNLDGESISLDEEMCIRDRACPVRQLPQVRQPHRKGLCGVPRVQHPGAQRLPQLPSSPRCPLEGVPLLPNSHSIAHAPLAGCKSAPVFARRSNTERRALV